jgi:EAL domain-containing protein (putative c-di-GMP-specific phosphodiesterase class I)
MTAWNGPVLDLPGNPLLEFLPAVDLVTGQLLALEALVRWEHPTEGLIPPQILLPWAEAHDGLLALNAWVIDEACHQAQTWSAGIQIAVNYSIEALRRSDASRATAAALEDSGLNPDRLTVEVSEETIADEQSAGELRALVALGVHLAADDVGGRWPSLQPLQQFHVETVKIDRPFITSLEAGEGMNRSIVDALVHVSHSLHMSNVAEGVETLEQVHILRELGTDAAQGYFFSRPISTDAARQLATTEPRPVFYVGQSNSRVATHGSLGIVDHPRGDSLHLDHLDPGHLDSEHGADVGHEIGVGRPAVV